MERKQLKKSIILLSIILTILLALIGWRIYYLKTHQDDYLIAHLSHNQIKDTPFKLVAKDKNGETHEIASGYILKESSFTEDIVLIKDENEPIELTLITENDKKVIYNSLQTGGK